MTYRTTPGACLHCAVPLERLGNRLACPTCRSCLVAMADLEAAMRAMWRNDQVPPRVIFVPLVRTERSPTALASASGGGSAKRGTHGMGSPGGGPEQGQLLVDGFARSRPCPVCTDVMAPCLLLTISVDRCRAHGVWLDHDELERVLHASAPRNPDEKDGALATAGGIVEGLGDVLEILGIFVPFD